VEAKSGGCIFIGNIDISGVVPRITGLAKGVQKWQFRTRDNNLGRRQKELLLRV
jgi:hypothetical protein